VLYLGTEFGLFVSIDRGRGWQRVKANLPTVRIDEITIHPRDNAMLLAGAVPAAALALLIQWAFDVLERRVIPDGLQERRGGLAG